MLELEQERIFGSAWHYVGVFGDGANAIPGRAGRVPVVITRDEAGVERAFVNVCRHRGSVVVAEPGNRKTLQCPYHAWTYGLDGALRSAPRADELEGAPDLSLAEIRLEAWGPFRFVNLDDDAAPLADLLGEVPQMLAAAGIDVGDLAFHHRTEWEVAANWKIVVENFLECYHCAVAHPGFSAEVETSPDSYRLVRRETHWSQFGRLKAPTRRRRRSGAGFAGAAGGTAGDAELPEGQFHLIWPNTGINVFPSRPNLSIGPIVPLAPDRTWRALDYFFTPGDDDAWIAEFVEFDDQVGNEDTRLVELVQRGAGSGALDHGHLLPESEQLVAGFQSRVRDALT